MVFRFTPERFGHMATLYSLPGVPFEALGALQDVVDDICIHNSLKKIYHRTIMTYGIAESALAKRIEAWEDALPEDIHLAYLPNALTGVRLRLSAYGDSDAQQERIEAEIASLKEIIGDVIYSYEDDTLENCIGKLLKKHGKTISTAESCTGGLIASMITSVPGASEYFLGSVVSYANSVKQNVLGVTEDILQNHGAVSSECVGAMSEGVRKLTGTDFAVATSGIAGPGGGSDEKPVGLVWIGVSSEAGTETFRLVFNSDRKRNIERFASSALYKIFNWQFCGMNGSKDQIRIY
jgi:nicotinamide-nucleotide amidase